VPMILLTSCYRGDAVRASEAVSVCPAEIWGL
jgi:hypothetical protein